MKKVNVSERRWRRSEKSAKSRADRRFLMQLSHDFLLSFISTRSALSSLTLVRCSPSWIDRRSRLELGQDTINRIFMYPKQRRLWQTANISQFSFSCSKHESFSLCLIWNSRPKKNCSFSQSGSCSSRPLSHARWVHWRLTRSVKEKKAIKAHAKVKVPVSKVLIKSKSTLAIYC